MTFFVFTENNKCMQDAMHHNGSTRDSYGIPFMPSLVLTTPLQLLHSFIFLVSHFVDNHDEAMQLQPRQ